MSDAEHAELIDGKAIAQTIRREVAAEVAKLCEKYGKVLFWLRLGMHSYTYLLQLRDLSVLLTEPRASSSSGWEPKGL